MSLYIDKALSLKEVMDVLEREHNFKASYCQPLPFSSIELTTKRQKQFKSKLMEWNLRKNIKPADMQYIASLMRARRETGKSTVVRVRGEMVDRAKIERWLKRNPNLDLSMRESEPLTAVSLCSLG